MGKSSINGPFSMAMSNYQRVYILVLYPWLGQGLVAAWPTLSCVVDFQFLAEEVCHNKMPAHSKVH